MKKLTVAVAGLMAVAAGANASMSRWDGFGAASAYIADVQDIWTLPGVVASNKNAMYLELGQNNEGYTSGEGWGEDGDNSYLYHDLAPSNAWGGIHTEMGPGVLGVWMNRPYTEGGFDVLEYEFSRPNSFGSAVTWDFSIDQTMDILYGWALNDKSTIGISLSRAWGNKDQKSETPGGTNEFNRDFQDLGLGLGWEQKEVGPIALLEIGLTFNTLSGVNTTKNPTTTDKYTRSGSDIDLRVGGDIAGDEGKFGRVELGLNMDGKTFKAEPQTAPGANNYVEGKNSGFGYNLGYAMGKSGEKGMGLVGLMLINRTDSADAPFYGGNDVNKADFNEFRLELSTAAEAKVKEWLTVRAGFSSNLLYSATTVVEQGTGTTTKNTNVNTERWDSVYGYNNLAKASFGTSIMVGNLTIDGVLNQDLLYTGSYLVSGVPAAMSTKVSATWGW